MGYLFKKTENQDKTIIELRTKYANIFTLIIILLLVPIAIFLVTTYFNDNPNLFRLFLVLFMIGIYTILDGKSIIKILFAKNKVRKVSVFSFKNPVKYTFLKK